MAKLTSVYDVCKEMFRIAKNFVQKQDPALVLYTALPNGQQYKLVKLGEQFTLTCSVKQLDFTIELGVYSQVEPGDPALFLRVPLLAKLSSSLPLPMLGMYLVGDTFVWVRQAKPTAWVEVRTYVRQGATIQPWLGGKVFNPEQWFLNRAATKARKISQALVGNHPQGGKESMIIDDGPLYKWVYLLYEGGKQLPILPDTEVQVLLRSGKFKKLLA